MREQPHWTNVLTIEFFQKHYVEERMSYPKLRELLLTQGHNCAIGTIYKYAKSLGFGRDASEAKRNRDPNPLDYTVSYLDERTIEAIDGFLLGDGHIYMDKRSKIQAGRLTCSLQHELFCTYLMQPFEVYVTAYCEQKSPKSPSDKVYQGMTKFHPDFYKQKQRWYPDSGKKQPPDDVRITPTSVMMWYLGDGSLVNDESSGSGTVMLRLSTDGFIPERVEFLAKRLQDVAGIACHRNNDNRIFVEVKGIPAFFDFIGRKSPVKCYDYKFDLPEWRFNSKRMSEVAEELNLDYNKLAYWVKIGRVPCFRATEGSKPRFTPEHVEKIKDLL